SGRNSAAARVQISEVSRTSEIWAAAEAYTVSGEWSAEVQSPSSFSNSGLGTFLPETRFRGAPPFPNGSLGTRKGDHPRPLITHPRHARMRPGGRRHGHCGVNARCRSPDCPPRPTCYSFPAWGAVRPGQDGFLVPASGLFFPYMEICE